MTAHAYPVRIDATLDEVRLSRWLWLVKWLLLVPHLLVLAVLWVVLVVLSAVALVGILLTGRYPRSIFEFNVGVLRWTWRVAFYGAGGFGTDRYPPFSLEERADYPAHLVVEYPGQMSRGLVLVKWWLLAIPHYLVLGFLLGGSAVVVSGSGGDTATWGGGLITLLSLIAAVVLLVTGRYPRPVFDLVLGLDRWALRVAAYAALMTDEYPPFRLDQGGEDPGTLALRGDGSPAGGTVGATGPAGAVPAGPAGADPGAPGAPGLEDENPQGSSRGTGRIVAVVLASLAALVGVATLVGGVGLAVVDSTARDADGFLATGDVRVSSPGYAVLTDHLEIHTDGDVTDLPERVLGTVRVESRDVTGRDTFVGIARSADVEQYLDGVARSTITQVDEGQDGPRYDEVTGGAPPTPPGEQDFWLASAEGAGTQSVEWRPESGSWVLVVMTADAEPSVETEVSLGATVPVLDDLALGMVVGALVVLGLAGLVIALALARPSPRRQVPEPGQPG